MSHADCLAAIRNEEGLALEYQSESGLIVWGRNLAGFRCAWAIPRDALEGASWQQLRGVLVGEREAKIMRHVTRVVGYWSNIRNWNRSKRRELRDRHKGDYAVN